MHNLKLETDRLMVTTFDVSMAEVVHLNSLDEYNRRFVPDEVFETVDEAKGVIEFLMNYYGSKDKGPLVYPVILKSGKNIGYVQAVPLDGDEWEIGYHIAEQYTKKGYATEAVKLFIPEIVKFLDIKHIWGICRGDNISSCKVLEKCCFELKESKVTDYKGEQHKVCKYIYNV